MSQIHRFTAKKKIYTRTHTYIALTHISNMEINSLDIFRADILNSFTTDGNTPLFSIFPLSQQNTDSFSPPCDIKKGNDLPHLNSTRLAMLPSFPTSSPKLYEISVRPCIIFAHTLIPAQQHNLYFSLCLFFASLSPQQL